MRLDPTQVAMLVESAAQGDQKSWDALVHAFGGMIWRIARSYGLSASEAADISQTTWLRLCEHIDRLRDGTALGSWLATTARRECSSYQARNRPLAPLEDLVALGLDADESEVV